MIAARHLGTRIAGAIVAVLMASFGAPITAGASPPAASPLVAALSALPTVGPPTTIEALSGSGFGVQESVAVTFDNPAGAVLASFTSRTSGAFSGTVAVPASARPGAHRFYATGRTTGRRASAAFLVRTNWTMVRRDAGHSGANPYENVLSAANVANLHETWFAPDGDFRSAPVVAGGSVFSGTLGGPEAPTVAIGAFTASDGFERYRALLSTYDEWPGSAPAVGGGMVFMMTGDMGWLSAIDQATGTERWSTSLADLNMYFNGQVTYANGLVYADRGAFNASTGALVWKIPDSAPHQYYGSPAVVGGIAYYGTADGFVQARDAATGVVRWARQLAGATSVPAVVGNTVYIGGGNNLVALDAQTGAKRWSAARSAPVGDPSVAKGQVVVGVGDRLEAFDAATGVRRWTVPLAVAGVSSPVAAPALANGLVFIGIPNRIAVFNAATGALLKTAPVFSGTPELPLAVADGYVYVDANEYIIAFTV